MTPDRNVSEPDWLRRKRTLVVLLVPVVATSAMSLTGTALAPALLADHPLALVALNPVLRHLLLATGSVDALPFFAVALCRLFAPDTFYFLIGRGWGRDAVDWIERRSGGAGKAVRLLERTFARAGLALVFVAPAGLVCVLAGAARMRLWLFVAVDLLGTFTALVLVRLFGAALADPIEIVKDFVQANVLVLTLGSIAAVAVSSVVRRRRARRLGPRVERDVEL